MPIPTNITDLSPTASSNSPTGNENPIEGDNHLRTAYAFIRQLYDGATGAAYATLADLANTTDAAKGDALVGVFHSGTGSLARTQHDRNEDDMHLSDKGTTADMLTALQDVASDFAAGGFCQIEAGTWTLSGTFSFTGQRLHLRGKGRQVSIVSFTPGAADVALEVNEPSAGGSNQGSINGLGFTSGNSVDKTAIRLVNVANWDIGHIGISTNAWQGDSIGIKTEGRQLLYIHDCEIACARPIVIGNNATFPTISADHSVLERLELIGTSATRPVLEFENGTTFANLTIRNFACVKGQHGIYWNDTTSTGASFKLHIEDFRSEQGLDSAAYSIYLASTAQTLQDVIIENALLDNARNGIFLRNCQRVTLRNVTFNTTTGTALDMTFVAGSRLILENCSRTNSAAAITLTNARLISREDVTGMGVREEWIFDAATSSGSVTSDVYHGGKTVNVASAATTVIADNSFTGFVMITEAVENVSAIFALNGTTQTTNEVSDPSGFYSVTAGTASSNNVYWDAGSSRYVLQNNRAATRTYSFYRIGTAA